MRAHAVFVLAMAGCVAVPLDGPDPQGYTWRQDGPRGAPIVHRGEDVYLRCGLDQGAKACARIAGGICDVYLPARAAPWLEAHELKHCEGWRHARAMTW